MTNVFTTVQTIASGMLARLTDSLIVARLAATDMTSDFTSSVDGHQKGDTIKIITGPTFESKTFADAITVQDIRTSTRNVTVDTILDTSVEITPKDRALSFEGFERLFIEPAARELAESIDKMVAKRILEGHGLYHNANLLSTAADMAKARKAANYQQLNAGGRFCLVDDTLEADLLGYDWFNQIDKRGDSARVAFTEGTLGRAMGFDFFSSLNFPSDDAKASGTYGTGVAVTNNGANGNTNNKVGETTLTIDGGTASTTFKVGDHLQIAGVRRPVVVKTAVANVGSATSVALVDPITEIVPDNAAVTVIGSGLAYTKRGAIFDGAALAVAMPPLVPMEGLESAVATENGVGLRVSMDSNITDKKTTMSIDVLIGTAVMDPRRITLLSSAD